MIQYREFHDAGYGVIGLHRVVDGNCTCDREDCPTAGKHPIIGSWQSIPCPWSDDQLDVMEQMGHFDTGYGVSCRGLLVVDIDARNGGVDSYERLLEKCPSAAGSGLIVETGSGGGSKHLYFKVDAGVALLSHLRDYDGIDFRSGSGAFVVGPGSVHKSGRHYVAVVGSPDEIEDAPADLLEMLKRPATVRVEYDGRTLDVSYSDVSSMIGVIPNSDVEYDDFIQMGMALHDATGGMGYQLWDQWAAKSRKYDPEQMAYWWQHFGKHPHPVTVGTLIYKAMENGWQRPVEIGHIAASDDPIAASDDKYPVDIRGVDTLKPPGFVGEVATWIAAQPRRKRDALAVGAALVAVGNHVGLRYVDERDGVTGNMIAFGVAGSATGKEAIQQAFAELHRATGISAAVHGAIKSEAEIYRNLIRHQAAFYNVDEISDFLEKLNNSKKRGGASYLEGVVAAVMSAYTKSNGYMLLTGDAKEDMRQSLMKEYAQEEKRLDNGQGSEQRLAEIQVSLDGIDKGLCRPFLSMCGYGTNEKFAALMDFRSATEGFFGRAMVFYERDTTPRIRKGWRRIDLPDSIVSKMQSLYDGPMYDAMARRVEFKGERVKVPTNAEASEMLTAIMEWMDDQAEKQSGTTGLEALHMRGYELVSKISFILAAPHGLRTAEHVRWAFALVVKDLELKTMLVMSNDRKLEDPGMALIAKVMALLDTDHAMTTGQIKNRCRGYQANDIDAALKFIVDKGEASCEETKHPLNGKVSKHYRRIV